MVSPEKNCGIYWIKNIINNNIYIGSSVNYKQRCNLHKSKLRRKVHENKHLQAVFNLYGEENLVFELLITCDRSLLIWCEQQFIDQWKPEYNICKDASRPNKRQYTKEEREKVSREHKGKIVSAHTRNLISKSRKGIKFTEEHIKNISLSHCRKWKLISPNNEIIEIDNMKDFCRNNDLNYSSIKSLLRGVIKQHKNYKLYVEDGIL